MAKRRIKYSIKRRSKLARKRKGSSRKTVTRMIKSKRRRR